MLCHPFAEATMNGLKVISTQIGNLVTGKTADGPHVPFMLSHKVSGLPAGVILLSI
jgi:hypothetical protein